MVHRLNNLLARILAAAESALQGSLDAPVRAELETIAGLVEVTAETIRDGAATRRPAPDRGTDIRTI